jgi:competence protein ComEC
MAIVEKNLPNDEFRRRTRLGAGDGKLYLKCLDMGQGDCTFIVCPNGKRMMVDAGTTDWGLSDIDDLIKELPSPLEPIDILVMTHSDQDHYNKIGDLVGNAFIEKVYFSGDLRNDYSQNDFRKWHSGSGKYKGKKANIGASTAITVNRLLPNRREILDGTFGGGSTCKFFVIASNVVATTYTTDAYITNTKSVVIKCEFGNDNFIIAADATCDTERFMVSKFSGALKVKYLRVGHHGSTTSSGSEFIDETSPEVAIISCKKSNAFGHPKRSVIDRLKAKVKTGAAKHLMSYYDDGDDAAECQSSVEDARPREGFGLGVNFPFKQVSTTDHIFETDTDGDYIVAFDGT